MFGTKLKLCGDASNLFNYIEWLNTKWRIVALGRPSDRYGVSPINPEISNALSLVGSVLARQVALADAMQVAVPSVPRFESESR